MSAMHAEHVPRFNLDEPGQSADMLNYLEENGYAIVASVASADEIQTGKDSFWKHMKTACPNVIPTDLTMIGLQVPHMVFAVAEDLITLISFGMQDVFQK